MTVQPPYTDQELLGPRGSLSELARRTDIPYSTLSDARHRLLYGESTRTRGLRKDEALSRVVDGVDQGEGQLRYVYLHELVCLWCGREVARVRSPERMPRRLFVLGPLRCDVCGGWPVRSGEYRRILAFREPLEKLKRGRPPRAALEALKPQEMAS